MQIRLSLDETTTQALWHVTSHTFVDDYDSMEGYAESMLPLATDQELRSIRKVQTRQIFQSVEFHDM